MDLNAAVASLMKLHQTYGVWLDSALLVFVRTLTFVHFSPIFGRKDIPFQVKVAFSIFITAIMLMILPDAQKYSPVHGNAAMMVIQVIINATIGFVLSFLVELLHSTVTSSGDLMNMQMGLSNAMIMNPGTRAQGLLFNSLFSFLFTAVFLQIGGALWLLQAFRRTFELIPVSTLRLDLFSVFDPNYIVKLSAGVLTVAVEFAAPLIVVTMAMDIILGVLNKSAQQIPVFQLSMGLKPTVGLAAFWIALPIFMRSVIMFLGNHARIF